MSAEIALAAKLDLRAAGPLRDEILTHNGADLTLDASAVTFLGGLSLQVIRAAARSWSEAGHKLTFSGASTDLCDQLHLLGFAEDTVTQWEATT